MRKLTIINHSRHTQCVPTFAASGIYLPHSTAPIPFSNAKSLLGNEYSYAIYDMRAENGVNFNLEAFAIVAGTIQQGGTLYLLCSDWEKVENQPDWDSERWNDGNVVATPNFWAFFKALVHKYGFEIPPLFSKEGEIWQKKLTEQSLSHFGNNTCQISPNLSLLKRGTTMTEEQAHILKYLPLANESIHLITAPRGRGKSTLSGKLAEKISQTHQVIITARSKAVLPNFWTQADSEKIRFFSPDALIQAVQNGENVANVWLFIDEAASLPLPILQTLCTAFAKIVMTTTTQNYEGTGRGFELKLPAMLDKPFQHWTMSQPLRWNEGDPLEQFVNELLLLSPLFNDIDVCRGELHSPPKKMVRFQGEYNSPLQFFLPLTSQGTSPVNEGKKISSYIAFYHLLSTAHYKTTPSDLRRLFDGENQQRFSIIENDQLVAGCWAVNEGGLSEPLTQAVWQGVRRPKGSLVAQYLCFQGNLPQACRLRSLRISRIAVQPEMQGKGYGKRLISTIILQIAAQNHPLDFMSVSFGMSDKLLKFWLACGFQLVQISQNREASSGLLSAMMIYPISEQGKAFCRAAVWQFERDKRADLTLTSHDLQNLWGFAYAKRTLAACEMSLQRLCRAEPALSPLFIQAKQQKSAVAELRLALQKMTIFSAKENLFAKL